MDMGVCHQIHIHLHLTADQKLDQALTTVLYVRLLIIPYTDALQFMMPEVELDPVAVN
jgi:hypothetical protein